MPTDRKPPSEVPAVITIRTTMEQKNHLLRAARAARPPQKLGPFILSKLPADLQTPNNLEP